MPRPRPGRRALIFGLDGSTLSILLFTATVAAAAVSRLAVDAPVPDARDRVPHGDAALQELTERGHAVGPRSAPIQAVAFFDYQCELCALFHQLVADLQVIHPGKIAIRYRHYPLTSVHPFALPAAVGAECAADQAKFDDWHSAVLLRQSAVGTRPWTDFAADAGIPDQRAFERCMESGRAHKQVERDRQLAIRLRLRGTPAVIINGRVYYGSRGIDVLDSLIRSRRLEH